MDSDTPMPATQGLPQDQPTDGYKEVIIHIPFPSAYVYSNCACFALSPMDFRIGFAESMPNGTAESRVGIVMPPEQAVVLAMMLLTQISVYEQKFGEIRNQQWREMKRASGGLPAVAPTP